MCGRYDLNDTPRRLAVRFGIQLPLPKFGPSWNIAPAQNAPVVRLTKDGQRELALLRCGLLIPFWADDPRPGLLVLRFFGGAWYLVKHLRSRGARVTR
jgi:putative SOS response-associated peptidase YedK